MELRGPFDGFVEKAVRASTTCLIWRIIIATASMRGPPAAWCWVALPCRTHRSCCSATRWSPNIRATSGAIQIIYDPWHYLPVLIRKPGALRNGAPFQGLGFCPPALTQVRAKLKQHTDGYATVVARCWRRARSRAAAVEAACAEALERVSASGDVILTVLARRRQPAAPPSITTPDALSA